MNSYLLVLQLHFAETYLNIYRLLVFYCFLEDDYWFSIASFSDLKQNFTTKGKIEALSLCKIHCSPVLLIFCSPFRVQILIVSCMTHGRFYTCDGSFNYSDVKIKRLMVVLLFLHSPDTIRGYNFLLFGKNMNSLKCTM